MSEPPVIPPLLDANVPMYAAGADHSYRDACQWVMTEVTNGRLIVAIDVEMIQEILHRYSALGRHAEAVTMAAGLLALIPIVYPVTPNDVQTAIALFQQYASLGVRSRDAIHAAVMLNNGLTEIISADRHFAVFAGIHRVDPIDLYQRACGHQP